jgi:dienelactone hydrolase
VREEARDIAHRGYLTAVVQRRGFGQSDGIPGHPADQVGDSCGAPDRGRAAAALFESSADDLEAALAVLATRPDADPARAIVIGQSAAGPAALALAARRVPGLRAVIDVSGGLQCVNRSSKKNEIEGPEVLAPVMTEYGARATVPSLWLWSENDHLMTGSMIRGWHKAYVDAGGKAELVVLPPLDTTGHDLFNDGNGTGRHYWLRALDPFLRHHGLPTWNLALADEVMTRHHIAPQYRDDVMKYLSGYTQKALAVDRTNGKPYWYSLPVIDLEVTSALVMLRCEEQPLARFAPAMENFRVLAPPEPGAADNTDE